MVQQIDTGHVNARLVLVGTPPLGATSDGVAYEAAYCTEYFNTGKYYFEVSNPAGITFDITGIGNSSASIADGFFPGVDTNSFGLQPTTGHVFFNSSVVYTIQTFTGTNVLGCAWDAIDKTMWWSEVIANPGVWYGSSTTPGNPTSNTGGADLSSIAGSTWTPGCATNTAATHTFAFASGSWTGAPPAGFGPFDTAPSGSAAGYLLFGQSVMLTEGLEAGIGMKALDDLIRRDYRDFRRLFSRRSDK